MKFDRHTILNGHSQSTPKAVNAVVMPLAILLSPLPSSLFPYFFPLKLLYKKKDNNAEGEEGQSPVEKEGKKEDKETDTHTKNM